MRNTSIKKSFAKITLIFFSLFLFGTAAAQKSSLSNLKGVADDGLQQDSHDSRPFVDGIAAVVNKNVITLRQLNSQVGLTKLQLQQQRIPVPDNDTLQKQVLQRMIMSELESQEAKSQNIVVSENELNNAINMIASRNRITPEQMKSHIISSGQSWEDYTEMLRKEVSLDILRQGVIDSILHISDAEVDSFLRNEGRNMIAVMPQTEPEPEFEPEPELVALPLTVQPSGQFIGFSQILIAVPEHATSSRVAELQSRANDILQRLKSGSDFAGTAAAMSDGPQALEGGDMGARPSEGWPDLFLQASRGLRKGGITKVFKSGNGFHILKVTELQGPTQYKQVEPKPKKVEAPKPQKGPIMVNQTKARHILIKTNKVVNDEKAKQRLDLVKARVGHGEDFSALAKLHSEDSTAPLGGDLGWLNPGETVPAFETAMDKLDIGQVSDPIKSQFGWHLIVVDERRSKDMEDEYKRIQAREILFQRRVEPALEDWINQLQAEAYIENRLDPSSNRNNRRR